MIQDRSPKPLPIEISNDSFLRVTWGIFAFVIMTTVSGSLWIAGIKEDARAQSQEARALANEAQDRVQRQGDSIREMRTSITDIDRRTIRMETILNELKQKL